MQEAVEEPGEPEETAGREVQPFPSCLSGGPQLQACRHTPANWETILRVSRAAGLVEEPGAARAVVPAAEGQVERLLRPDPPVLRGSMDMMGQPDTRSTYVPLSATRAQNSRTQHRG